MKIKLASDKGFTLVDKADFEYLNQFRWYLSKAGYVCHSHYSKGKRILWYMHKEIMKPAKGFYTDHISMDKLDNRRKNLRVCTLQQNNTHRPARNKYGFKGVTWNKIRNKWQVILHKNKKQIWGGYAKTLEEAGILYNTKALQLHGQFAVLNQFHKDLDKE